MPRRQWGTAQIVLLDDFEEGLLQAAPPEKSYNAGLRVKIEEALPRLSSAALTNLMHGNRVRVPRRLGATIRAFRKLSFRIQQVLLGSLCLYVYEVSSDSVVEPQETREKSGELSSDSEVAPQETGFYDGDEETCSASDDGVSEVDEEEPVQDHALLDVALVPYRRLRRKTDQKSTAWRTKLTWLLI
jgi:hypothetical protein